MKNEIKQRLEKTLDASYSNLIKNGNEKAIGAIRCITGLTQGDQGFVHLENIYIKNNTIQLGAYHNKQEETIRELNSELTKIKDNTDRQIKELSEYNQELTNRINQLEQFVKEIKQFNLD